MQRFRRAPDRIGLRCETMRAGAERSAGSLARAMRATRRSCSSRAGKQVPEGNQLRWRRRPLRRSARLRRATYGQHSLRPRRDAPVDLGLWQIEKDEKPCQIPRRATYAPAPKKRVPRFAQARSRARGALDSRRRDEGLSRATHRAFRAIRTETPPGEAALPARAVLAALRRIAARGRPLQATREYKNPFHRRRSRAFHALRIANRRNCVDCVTGRRIALRRIEKRDEMVRHARQLLRRGRGRADGHPA